MSNYIKNKYPQQNYVGADFGSAARDEVLQSQINSDVARIVKVRKSEDNSSVYIQLWSKDGIAPLSESGPIVIDPTGRKIITKLQIIDVEPSTQFPSGKVLRLYFSDSSYIDCDLSPIYNDINTKVAAEKTRAEGAENALDTRVGANTTNIASVNSRLNDEISSRQEADTRIDTKFTQEVSTLTTNLNKEIADRKTADTTEKTERVAKDNELAQSITTESTERKAEDDRLEDKIDTLDDKIDATDAKIDAEIEERKEKDRHFQTSIEQVKVDLEGEISRSIDAETTLANSIATLRTDLDAEEEARILGDAALTKMIEDGLKDEAEQRESEDTTLRNLINGKVTAEITSDNGRALIFNEADGGGAKFEKKSGGRSFVGVNDDTTNGVAAQIYAVNSSLVGPKLDITENGIYYSKENKPASERDTELNEIVTLGQVETKGSVQAEKTRAEAAEATLQTNINTEKTERESADGVLKTLIKGVSDVVEIIQKDYLKAADKTELQGNITTEATTRATADTALESKITAEETARTSGDAALQTDIDGVKSDVSEIKADYLKTADKTALETKITTEETARISGDSTLQTNINAEATTREQADTTLQTNIDAVSTTVSEHTAKLNNTVQLMEDPDLLSALNSKVEKELSGTNGKALVFNESDGGGLKFTHKDGTISAVAVNDGGASGIAAQIYAVNSSNTSEGVKLNVEKDKITYIKNKATSERTTSDEIAVKGDFDAALEGGEDLDSAIQLIAEEPDTWTATNIQRKLTAGTNITISADNVISATGGGASIPTIKVYQSQVRSLDPIKVEIPETDFTTLMENNFAVIDATDLHSAYYLSVHKGPNNTTGAYYYFVTEGDSVFLNVYKDTDNKYYIKITRKGLVGLSDTDILSGTAPIYVSGDWTSQTGYGYKSTQYTNYCEWDGNTTGKTALIFYYETEPVFSLYNVSNIVPTTTQIQAGTIEGTDGEMSEIIPVSMITVGNFDSTSSAQGYFAGMPDEGMLFVVVVTAAGNINITIDGDVYSATDVSSGLYFAKFESLGIHINKLTVSDSIYPNMVATKFDRDLLPSANIPKIVFSLEQLAELGSGEVTFTDEQIAIISDYKANPLILFDFLGGGSTVLSNSRKENSIYLVTVTPLWNDTRTGITLYWFDVNLSTKKGAFNQRIIYPEVKTTEMTQKVGMDEYGKFWTVPGGGASWGNITGTLSAQSDLNTALNAKQNVLTAGSGIAIQNNVISASLGYEEVE